MSLYVRERNWRLWIELRSDRASDRRTGHEGEYLCRKELVSSFYISNVINDGWRRKSIVTRSCILLYTEAHTYSMWSSFIFGLQTAMLTSFYRQIPRRDNALNDDNYKRLTGVLTDFNEKIRFPTTLFAIITIFPSYTDTRLIAILIQNGFSIPSAVCVLLSSIVMSLARGVSHYSATFRPSVLPSFLPSTTIIIHHIHDLWLTRDLTWFLAMLLLICFRAQSQSIGTQQPTFVHFSIEQGS